MNTTIGTTLGAAASPRVRGAAGESAPASGAITTAWSALRLTFGLVPIVAGLDKFTNLLVDWGQYLHPAIADMAPIPVSVLMGVVGVVEIGAGLLVLARPRIGGFVVMSWLILIALSLVASGRYLDVAVRDLVMALGAFTLASLTPAVERLRADERPR